jgi:hypothetical protein
VCSGAVREGGEREGGEGWEGGGGERESATVRIGS